jgi:hypothetical protein
MHHSHTQAQRLKFQLLASGLEITASAADVLEERNEGRALTPADYASTSGLILRLEDDVWVNAPISLHNPNFVSATPFRLDWTGLGFEVRGGGLASVATIWLPPRYHGENGSSGRPLNHFVFTHGDRARLAPMQGCAMTCKFCNIPYEDRYRRKPVDAMVEALHRSLTDDLQPAHHLLISGGTPRPADVGYLRDVYLTVLDGFPDLEVDIMMVPVDGLLDVEELAAHGLNELSINLEVFSESQAARLMRQKHAQGRDHYLDFIESAAAVLGPGRVRSMLMVGLEPMEDTLAGVSAIVERGGAPVLSPFRPDPATPLRDLPPPSAQLLEETFERASDIAGPLGPSCPPCTHNTLTLVTPGAHYTHPVPELI